MEYLQDFSDSFCLGISDGTGFRVTEELQEWSDTE